MEKYRDPREGVQVHRSMVDFHDISDDGCSVFESRVLPYRNIEECRKLLAETHKRNFKEMMDKYFPEEQKEDNVITSADSEK